MSAPALRILPQCRTLGEALAHASRLDRAGLLPAPLSSRLLVDLMSTFGEVDVPAAAVPALLGSEVEITRSPPPARAR